MYSGEDEPKDHERKLRVVVHNEEDGGIATIEAVPEALVSAVVSEMYREFGLERKPGDRLRCEASGGDVFAHEREHLEAYAQTQCEALVWLFVGDQGGA